MKIDILAPVQIYSRIQYTKKQKKQMSQHWRGQLDMMIKGGRVGLGGA